MLLLTWFMPSTLQVALLDPGPRGDAAARKAIAALTSIKNRGMTAINCVHDESSTVLRQEIGYASYLISETLDGWSYDARLHGMVGGMEYATRNPPQSTTAEHLALIGGHGDQRLRIEPFLNETFDFRSWFYLMTMWWDVWCDQLLARLQDRTPIPFANKDSILDYISRACGVAAHFDESTGHPTGCLPQPGV